MMDKAKAYDEALEKARQDRDAYQKELDKTDKNSQLANILRAGISALEIVFPVLKESDDERIRKDIIDHFESIKSQALYDNQEESDNIISSCNEKIAYLEKQKECIVDNTSEDEQKPADDKAFEEWIDSWFKEHKEKAYPQITMDEKEFKNFCRGIRNMYQQKSDWNEEDEEIIYSLRSFLIQAEQSGRYGSIQIAQIEQCLNWLKSVHPIKQDWTEEDEEALDMCIDAIPKRWKTKSGILLTKWLKDNIHLQPKQDWNEEDEEIWFALITFFKTYLQKYPPLCKDEKTQANRILKWLNTTIKSFRLYHRYKPSEEQIEALERTIHLSNFGTEENRRKSLSSLLKELKKLGVKEEPEYYQHFDPDC